MNKIKPHYSVMMTTSSSVEEARKIAEALLNKKQAACVNIVGPMESHFVWKGKFCTEKEYLMVIKAREDHFRKIKETILKMHSYEVPEIILLPIKKGFDRYLRWIDETASAG